jgi:outer membrane PBP1 activator LpoA protein
MMLFAFLLVGAGIGLLAVSMSSHQDATGGAANDHAQVDAHMDAAAQTTQQGNYQQAAVHVAEAHAANQRAAKKVAQAAPVASTDREKRITALQAELTEANQAKIKALEALRTFSSAQGSNPAMQQLQAAAQAAYAATQQRVLAAQAALRALGVNPQDVYTGPRTDVRTDVSR